MAHLWSGRFAGDPDAALFEFGASFRFDRRLFEDDVTGSLAWADGLEKAGVLTAADASRIRIALEEIVARGASDPGFFASEDARHDEDIHSFVERELVARVGDAGGRLHTGRSRNEQVSVDLRLYLKRRIPQVQQTVASLVRELAGQAEAAGAALMPSYTHMRRAQPVLAAHFFLAHAAAFRRDYGRFSSVLVDVDELPLGSGAFAGTS
jgi:argininosuccinate lyase